MALGVGTRLGSYEITGPLGTGGMGEVYRATDTRLGRDVAIKTLPATLASDQDRLARFEREAKLLAALNHAHIGAIYGLDEHEGTRYIAMELVAGETLEEKLKAGPLPVEDALRVALQIAEALEAAHEKGVIHRDLKPANIMVTADGQVKVLDFGLAKAFSGDPSEASPLHSPALSVAMTQQGVILGTAGYMSPEQASGQATDQRADIWGFGVVFYEMLTGLPLFSGESVPHILAGVLKTDPDWSRLPKNLHPRLKQLLARCLEKKVRNRYHSIADVRVDIEAALNDPQGVTAATPVAQQTSRRALPLVAATAILTAAVASLVAWRLWPASERHPVNRFDYDLPTGQVFRNVGRPVIALSPDGRRFVYNTTDGLYLRSMDELQAQLIPGTEENMAAPFFPPDGKSVAYWAIGSQLKHIPLSGGAPTAITDFTALLYGASWGVDGTVLFGELKGVSRVSADGGTAKLVIPIKDGEQVYGPMLLPDGDSVLFSSTTTGDWDRAQIVVQSLSTNKRTVILDGGSDARYVPTGHLVYARGDSLFAVAFDPSRLTVSGKPVELEKGVMRAASNVTAAANYDVSNDGTLVYVSGNAGGGNALVWVDRNGGEDPLALKPCLCYYPALSPDGTRVAVSQITPGETDGDIWVWSITKQTFTRLTFGGDFKTSPLWTPDGKRIVYRSPKGIFWLLADGTGDIQQLIEGSDFEPYGWTMDGQLIFTHSAGGNLDIGELAVEGERKRRILLGAKFDEGRPALSPDGRWLAYQSNESGRFEIYVRPFPNLEGGKWQLSQGGGEDPRWAQDGRTLFFLGPKNLMATTVEAAPEFAFRPPQSVLERAKYYFPGGTRQYGLSPDAQRFLLIKAAAVANPDKAPRIVIVTNWFEELKRLVPTK